MFNDIQINLIKDKESAIFKPEAKLTAEVERVKKKDLRPYFIILIIYALTTPRNCICHSHWRVLVDLHPVCIRLDKLTKNLSFRILRVTKVHHFIKQFILTYIVIGKSISDLPSCKNVNHYNVFLILTTTTKLSRRDSSSSSSK